MGHALSSKGPRHQRVVLIRQGLSVVQLGVRGERHGLALFFRRSLTRRNVAIPSLLLEGILGGYRRVGPLLGLLCVSGLGGGLAEYLFGLDRRVLGVEEFVARFAAFEALTASHCLN